MKKIEFEQAGNSEIGHCKECHSKEFGIDRINGVTYVYCKNCGEEIIVVTEGQSNEVHS